MGSWAMGRVGRVTGWLTRSSQSWSLTFSSVSVYRSYFLQKLKARKKKEQEHVLLANPHFIKMA